MVQRDRSSLYKWSGENECVSALRSAPPGTNSRDDQSAELTATLGLLIPAILPKRRSSQVCKESM